MQTIRPVAARKAGALLTLATVLASLIVSVAPSWAGPNRDDLVPMSAGEGYTSLSPARLLDTRPGTATIDGQFVGGGAVERRLDLPVRGRGGVPSSGVRAVALNVTVTAPTNASFVTVWPAGEAQPNASNINFVPGQTIANAVIVKLGDDGGISFFNETGTTHLVVDVVGWYASDADYVPRVPARILDTRPDGQTVDGQFRGGAQPANVPISLTVTGRADVPSYATAIVLNVTIVAPTANSFATVWPNGTSMPNASNLNFEAGRNVANLVVAEVGTSGQVKINFAAGNAYVIADIVGWFGDFFDYVPVQPARLLDTRSPSATIDGSFSGGGPLSGGARTDLVVLGRGGVPTTGVDAVVVNVTATQPTNGSFVTVWPTDGQGPPNASTLNMVAGRTVPNLAIVKVGAGGAISLFNEQGATHLIVDVVGWFPTTFEISSMVIPPTSVGDASYSTSLQAVGGRGPYSWGVFAPTPGLSTSASGVMTGSASTAGTFAELIVATDADDSLAINLLPHHVFSSGDGYSRVTPTTLFDSFAGSSPVPAGTTRTISAGGIAGVPTSGVDGVVVNVVTRSRAANFLTAWGSGPEPDIASLINDAGIGASNVLVVPVTSSVQFNIRTATDADFSVELLGYFATSSDYEPTLPTRILDTRSSSALAPGAVAAAIPTSSVAPGATSVVLQVTTTNAAGQGSLDVLANGGSQTAPSMAWFPGTIVQTVVIPVGGGGIDVRNRAASTSSTDVMVDVVGYFEP